MARCPRCAVPGRPYTRCHRCGLVLGYTGLTVLVDFQESPDFDRLQALARRQTSYTERTEQNGRRYLRVTYPFSHMERVTELLKAGARLPAEAGKRVFVNGLEVRWPEPAALTAFGENVQALADGELDAEDNPLHLLTRYPPHLEVQA